MELNSQVVDLKSQLQKEREEGRERAGQLDKAGLSSKDMVERYEAELTQYQTDHDNLQSQVKDLTMKLEEAMR